MEPSVATVNIYIYIASQHEPFSTISYWSMNIMSTASTSRWPPSQSFDASAEGAYSDILHFDIWIVPQEWWSLHPETSLIVKLIGVEPGCGSRNELKHIFVTHLSASVSKLPKFQINYGSKLLLTVIWLIWDVVNTAFYYHMCINWLLCLVIWTEWKSSSPPCYTQWLSDFLCVLWWDKVLYV